MALKKVKLQEQDEGVSSTTMRCVFCRSHPLSTDFVGRLHVAAFVRVCVFFTFFFPDFYKYLPVSGQAVVTLIVSSPPGFLPSNFIVHRVQQSDCSLIFHRVLLTHVLALSASQFVHKEKSPRIYTSMHSGGFELTKPTFTKLEDNLIRHRGDRLTYVLATLFGTKRGDCRINRGEGTLLTEW